MRSTKLTNKIKKNIKIILHELLESQGAIRGYKTWFLRELKKEKKRNKEKKKSNTKEEKKIYSHIYINIYMLIYKRKEKK